MTDYLDVAKALDKERNCYEEWEFIFRHRVCETIGFYKSQIERLWAERDEAREAARDAAREAARYIYRHHYGMDTIKTIGRWPWLEEV